MSTWHELEHRLSGMFGSAKATAGGHDLHFVTRIDGRRLVTVVYVDGKIKGEWLEVNKDGSPAHPQGRFFCPSRTRLYPIKNYAKIKRVFGKRRADEMTELRTVCVSPAWSSPRSLVRHLKKYFPDLVLLDKEVVE